jgi:hypothetical protein
MLSPPSLRCPLEADILHFLSSVSYCIIPIVSHTVLLYRFAVIGHRTPLIPTTSLSKMLNTCYFKRNLKSFLCAKVISSYVLQNVISTTFMVDQKFTEVNKLYMYYCTTKIQEEKSTNMVRRMYGMLSCSFPVIHVLQS